MILIKLKKGKNSGQPSPKIVLNTKKLKLSQTPTTAISLAEDYS